MSPDVIVLQLIRSVLQFPREVHISFLLVALAQFSFHIHNVAYDALRPGQKEVEKCTSRKCRT